MCIRDRLWKDDFFGVANEDVNEIAFIDRINLFYKGCYDMEFTDEERVYVERAGATKTFDEVVELAIELYGLVEEKDLEKLASLPNEGNDMDFDLDDFELTPSQSDNQGEEQRIDSKKPAQSDSNPEDEGDEDEQDAPLPSTMGGDTGTVETEAKTDAAFIEALDSLIDEDAKEWVYLDLPKIDLDKFIIPSKQITETLYYHLSLIHI